MCPMTILFPISYACPFCFYIFLSLRPNFRKGGLYRAMDASVIQIATLQNISGIFDVFKSYRMLKSVLIVSSFEPNGNDSTRKNLTSRFFPYPSDLAQSFISLNKLQTLKNVLL